MLRSYLVDTVLTVKNLDCQILSSTFDSLLRDLRVRNAIRGSQFVTYAASNAFVVNVSLLDLKVKPLVVEAIHRSSWNQKPQVSHGDEADVDSNINMLQCLSCIDVRHSACYARMATPTVESRVR